MAGSKEERVALQPVDRDNWRDVRALEVTRGQRAFVEDPNYYLALCCYDTWNPLAVVLGGAVIGFLMWGVDDEDGSCWLGGIMIDRRYQRQGHGRSAIREAVALLSEQTGSPEFALSYQPANGIAARLYRSMGFVETEEWIDDEVIARLRA